MATPCARVRFDKMNGICQELLLTYAVNKITIEGPEEVRYVKAEEMPPRV